MEYRQLNICVISAEGLKNVCVFSKMDVYVVVSLSGNPKSKQKTFVDKGSGTSPEWKHPMEFIVDEPPLTQPGLFLIFQLKAKGTLGSTTLGFVDVPVNELFKPNVTNDTIVLYQVRTPSGKPKGSLKFSYRFGDKFTQNGERRLRVFEPQLKATESMSMTVEPVMAYPAAPYAVGGGYASAPPYPGIGYSPQYGSYGCQSPLPAGYAYPPPGGYAYPQSSSGYAPYDVHHQKDNGMGMGMRAA